MAAWDDLGLDEELVQAVVEMGWNLPRDVQAEAIPLILGGGDVLCSAPTGSGKTGAFALPIIQLTQEALRARRTLADAPATAPAAAAACVLDRTARDDVLAISPSGTAAESRHERLWGGARATWGVPRGAVASFDFAVQDTGLCRVGWALAAASTQIGTDASSWGFGGTGKRSHANTFTEYGAPFGKGDVVTTTCDRRADPVRISYALNGADLGVAFSFPAALPGDLAIYPAILLKTSSGECNFAGMAPVAAAQAAVAEARTAAARAELAGAALPATLVVEPTFEMAQQVCDELAKFTRRLSAASAVRWVAAIGGRGAAELARELKAGADIVVATPGKLAELLDKRAVELSAVRLVVMDEADQLAASHADLCLDVIAKVRAAARRRTQVCLFSATLRSGPISRLIDVCADPIWVDLKGANYVPDTVHHAVVEVDVRPGGSHAAVGAVPLPGYETDGVHARDRLASDVAAAQSEGVKRAKAAVAAELLLEKFADTQAMVFCRTRVDCDHLEAYLNLRRTKGGRAAPAIPGGGRAAGLCTVLHSGLSKGERGDRLTAFKDGDVRILICTDVAARGVDVEGLPLVLSVTLPDTVEDYVHRSGRVGRAERYGLSISIAAGGGVREKVWYHKCPSRGTACANTELTSAGGCCIWYDEPAYLAAIAERLGHPPLPLGPGLSLPDFGDGAVGYGTRRGGGGRWRGRGCWRWWRRISRSCCGWIWKHSALISRCHVSSARLRPVLWRNDRARPPPTAATAAGMRQYE